MPWSDIIKSHNHSFYSRHDTVIFWYYCGVFYHVNLTFYLIISYPETILIMSYPDTNKAIFWHYNISSWYTALIF